MSASLQELLQAQIRTQVITKILAGRGAMGTWLGFHPDKYSEDSVEISGPNTYTTGNSVRQHAYSIYNATRVPLKFTAPGTPAATTAANPVGQNWVSIARMHMVVNLNYEDLGQLSNMAGPSSQIDTGGQNYIQRQQGTLVEKGNNAIEFMAAGMLRDSLYMTQTGNNEFLPSFTAPSNPTTYGFQVPYNIPAGNKSQLNMLGTGDIIGTTWASASAPIVGDLFQIEAAYAQLTRMRLTDAWINSTMWINVISNTEVRNVAGSANTPFAAFEMDPAPQNHGPPMWSAKIKGVPFLTWRSCNDTLALGGDTDPVYPSPVGTATLNKLVPDNMVIFVPDPRTEGWTKLCYGGEYVADAPGMTPVLRMGWYSWSFYGFQPTIVQLFVLLNAVPELYRPAGVAPATTVFP